MSREKECDEQVDLHYRRRYLTDLAVLELQAGWKELNQCFECKAPSKKELKNQLVQVWDKFFAQHLVPDNKTLNGDRISSFLEVVIANNPEIVPSVVDRIDAKSDLCHASDGNRSNLLARHIPSLQSRGRSAYNDGIILDRNFLEHLLGKTTAEVDFPFVETTFEILSNEEVVMALWLFIVTWFPNIRTTRYSRRSRQLSLIDKLWRKAKARLNQWPPKKVMDVIVATEKGLPQCWDYLHPLMMMTVGGKHWEQIWIDDGKSGDYDRLSTTRPWSNNPPRRRVKWPLLKYFG